MNQNSQVPENQFIIEYTEAFSHSHLIHSTLLRYESQSQS